MRYLCILTAVVVSTASAQLPGPATGAPKDPAKAALLSGLVSGAGQIYGGRPVRGLTMMGLTYGAIVVGASKSTSDFCSTPIGPLHLSNCNQGGNHKPLVIGLIVGLSTWVYSIMDAAPSARMYNTEHGLRTALRIDPTIGVGSQGVVLGATLTF